MEYDDRIVRQLLECVVVDSKEQITVIFKGGLKSVQPLNEWQRLTSAPNFESSRFKDTIEIWTPKFWLNGVFIIKSSIYAAFRGRIFFLSAGLKTEKRKFYNPKI